MTFVVVVPIEVKGEEDNRIVSSKKKKKRVVRKKVTEIILLMREGVRPLHVCVYVTRIFWNVISVDAATSSLFDNVIVQEKGTDDDDYCGNSIVDAMAYVLEGNDTSAAVRNIWIPQSSGQMGRCNRQMSREDRRRRRCRRDDDRGEERKLIDRLHHIS